MKQFLTIAVVVIAVIVVGLWAFGAMGVSANDAALAEIQSAPGVIVLKVDGMT